MRLGDASSKPPTNEFKQVDHFLRNRKDIRGQRIALDAGEIVLNYYCLNCDDSKTFLSIGKIACVFVDHKTISIDAVFACNCGAHTQVWFLVECNSDICGLSPEIRILKRSEKPSAGVRIDTNNYGAYTELLDKSDRAYRDDLGASAIVYLRKALESIIMNMATFAHIDYLKHENGNPKNLKNLLKDVNESCGVIPSEFSDDGYRLFGELSSVIQGGYDETEGLKKYIPLRRLIIGILDNLKNRDELKEAIGSLGWSIERNGSNDKPRLLQ